MEKRLYRSRKNKVFAGVCGGLSEYFNISVGFIRFIVAFLILGYGTGFWLYILAAIFIPYGSSVKYEEDIDMSSVRDEFDSSDW